jgi:hypothetical protein
MNSTDKMFVSSKLKRGGGYHKRGLSLLNVLHFFLFCSRMMLPCLNASLVLLSFLYTPPAGIC